MTTVQTIYDAIDKIAPFRLAFHSFDNVGLLVGRRESAVSNVLFTLDLSLASIMEGKRLGCELIVAHHPVVFDTIRTVTSDDYAGQRILALAEAGMACICAHTNWDSADGGVNDVLVQLLGLTNVRKFGFAEPQNPPHDLMPSGRIGDLPSPVTSAELTKLLAAKLDFNVSFWGRSDQIRSVGIVGGAADSEWPAAKAAGADAFITGEVKQHNALEASEMGLVIFQCGHYATEHPAMTRLAERVSGEVKGIQTHVFTPAMGESGRDA